MIYNFLWKILFLLKNKFSNTKAYYGKNDRESKASVEGEKKYWIDFRY